MKNHKGKPVYTFDGCIAIMKTLPPSARFEFADRHRDLFRDSEKLAEVLKLLNNSEAFLRSQEKYWEKEFAASEELSEESSDVIEQQPAAKKAKPSSAAMFQSNVAKVHIGSDTEEQHHSRRNGHM